MEKGLELPPEDFDYVAGSSGLYAYGRQYGSGTQACPHMQGSAFYQHIHSPQVRQCQRCRKMWYCSPECQKEYWPTHQPRCVDEYSPLPISARGLESLGQPLHSAEASGSGTMTPVQSFSYPPYWQPQGPGPITLDVSNALKGGVVNKNAVGKKAAYDQLTPALVALFGRHALASQRLIWCNNKSNDGATKKAREHFVSLKSDLTAVMKYAHEKFLATRMRGALIMNVDTPCGLSDYMIGSERFNWLTFPDAQMTLCVKLQETIKAYDPSRAFVLVVYALSPDQLSAVLWAWTYTDYSRADSPNLLNLRTQIRQIMKDTKRAENHMYQVQKDQNDL